MTAFEAITTADPARRLRVCVARPSREYSETFIDNHINHLAAETIPAWDGFLPTRYGDGKWIMKRYERLLVRVADRIETLRPTGARLRTAAFARFLTRHRVDAVLAEYGPTGVHVMQAAKAASVPLIVHFHGYDAQRSSTVEKFGSRYRELFRESAAIIVVSKIMGERLKALGAPASKLHMIPCGVDPAVFGGARPGEQPPHFLAVGRFVEKKAPHLLLLSFAQVCKQVPGSRLTIAGTGPLLPACTQLVKALNLEHCVDLPGSVDHDQVSRLMRETRAFVQHSVTAPDGDAEGTPVSVLEALCSGLPVVSTRHGGIGDAILEGKTGFIVDELDLSAMAERMLTLATDPELAASMGQAARTYASTEFSLDRRLSMLMKVIQASVDGHRAPTTRRTRPKPGANRRPQLSGASIH